MMRSHCIGRRGSSCGALGHRAYLALGHGLQPDKGCSFNAQSDGPADGRVLAWGCRGAGTTGAGTPGRDIPTKDRPWVQARTQTLLLMKEATQQCFLFRIKIEFTIVKGAIQ